MSYSNPMHHGDGARAVRAAPSSPQIWLELPRPKSPEEAAELETYGNALLDRLQLGRFRFFWDVDGRQWLLILATTGEYWTLVNNGHWFSMARMGLVDNSTKHP